MYSWLGEVENKLMTKEALRDATVLVSPSSSVINDQNICTESQTDRLNHGLIDPCMTAHEKRQEKRFLLEGDEKEYSVFGPQEDNIAKFYTPSEPPGILSDARVFRLKPEYRKDNRPDEKNPSGTKVGVLKINGLWFRVILPHDSDVHSFIGTGESEEQCHFLRSPMSGFLQQSSNLSIVTPSSKVGRTLYVAFNQPMTPDEISMKVVPSTKVRNLTQYCGQWPIHKQISSTEDHFDCNVAKKRKSASTANAHEIKDIMVKKQKFSDSSHLYPQGCKSTFHTNTNKFALWTAKEEHTLMEWMEKIENGVATWDDVAAAIKSTGKERSVHAIRFKYNSLKKLRAEGWSTRPRWTTKEEQTLQKWTIKVENDIASWKDVAAAVSCVGSERSIKACQNKLHAGLSSEKDCARWTAKEERTLKNWAKKIENGVASWKDAAAAVSSIRKERSIKACQNKYHCRMQKRDFDSPGGINLELKKSTGGSDSCSESDSEGLSTDQLSESDWSLHNFKRNFERWTPKEEQTLKRWASMVENGDASWEDAAAAVSSTGSERTINACKRKYYSLRQKKVLVGLAEENPEVNGETRDRNLCSDIEMEAWNMADIFENESDGSNPVGSRTTSNIFSFITSWILKLFKAD